jgi:uncharacterized lipoprotein YmbA
MRYFAPLVLLLVFACAGSSPPRTLYLLRADATERVDRSDTGPRIGLGKVSIAPYLDQPGLVIEMEPGRVQVANEHHWAEPLDAGLRSFLRVEISVALGHPVSAGPSLSEWAYAVNVFVDQLHGSMGGVAVLDATYRIVPRAGTGETTEFHFSSKAPLPRAGYPGLVDAQAELVRELARAIARSLVERQSAGP